jgi:glutamate-ammonia-ligase adenylyltransferase
MAGEPTLGADVEDFRRALLSRKGQGRSVRADVATMRARLQGAKPSGGPLDAKNGAGRITDIELAAQTVALLAGNPARGVERQIAAGMGTILPETDAQALLSAYRLFWRHHAASRLLTEGTLVQEELGDGARAFLMRETGASGIEDLARRLGEAAATAEAAVLRLVAEAGKDREAGDGSGHV